MTMDMSPETLAIPDPATVVDDRDAPPVLERAGSVAEAVAGLAPVSSVPVADAARVAPAGWLAGLFGSPGKVPAERAGAVRLLTAARGAGGGGREVIGASDLGKALGAGGDPWAVFVRSAPWPMELDVPAAARDADGHAWDLLLEGRWVVADPAAFAAAAVLPLVTPEMPVTSADVRAFVSAKVGHLIKEEAGRHSAEDLRDRTALPPAWWEKYLGERLAAAGLRAEVGRVSFASASAAAAEERRLREEQERRAAQERRELLERRREQAEGEAQFRLTIKRIQNERAVVEADKALALADRQAQLRAIEAQERAAKEEQLRRELAFKLWQEEAALRIGHLRAAQEQELAAARERLARERAAQARQEQTAAEERKRRREREDQEHQAKLEQIGADVALSDEQRRAAREAAELQKELTRKQLEEAKRQAERAAELHKAQLAACEAELERVRKAAEQQGQLHAHLDAWHKNMAPLAEGLAALIAGLRDPDARRAYQAAAVLTQQAGAPAEALQEVACPAGSGTEKAGRAVGASRPSTCSAGAAAVTTAALVETWGAKAARDGHPVRLTKRGLVTRDIGVKSLNVLPIGSTLHFELSVDRPGYLTVLNLGTSGAFWLLCPGTLCAPGRSMVSRGRAYSIPGPELFPFDGQLVERGPGGWEHLVAIVSDRPLFDDAFVASRREGGPVAGLSGAEVRRVADHLNANPNAYSVGLLSFLVE